MFFFSPLVFSLREGVSSLQVTPTISAIFLSSPGMKAIGFTCVRAIERRIHILHRSKEVQTKVSARFLLFPLSLFLVEREFESPCHTSYLSLHSLFPMKESERVRICKCDKEERTYFTQVNRSAKKGVCAFVFLCPQVFFLQERRSTSHPEQHLDRTSRSFRPFFVLSHRYVLCYIFPPKKERRIYAQYR